MARDGVQLRLVDGLPDVAPCDACGHLFERAALLSTTINVEETARRPPVSLRFACCSGACTARAFRMLAYMLEPAT